MKLKVAILFIFTMLNSNVYADNCENIWLPEVKNKIVKLSDSDLTAYKENFGYLPYESVTFTGNKEFKKKYTTHNIKLKAKDPTNLVLDLIHEATLYAPKREGKRPLVIIYPSIKGVTYIEKNLAKYLAKKGFYTLVARVSKADNIHKLPIKALDIGLLRSTSAISLWVDYFTNQKYIDSSSIGIFGTSEGGNRISLAIGVEKRISATVMFVAGGNFPRMFADSEQKIIKRYREYKQATEHLNYISFHNKMSSELKFDPIHLAHTKNPDDIFMFIALKDTSVPTERQLELWHAFGRPKSICKDVNHLRGSLYSAVMEKEIFQFYTRRFKLKN